jgi:hypothetical protein
LFILRIEYRIIIIGNLNFIIIRKKSKEKSDSYQSANVQG